MPTTIAAVEESLASAREALATEASVANEALQRAEAELRAFVRAFEPTEAAPRRAAAAHAAGGRGSKDVMRTLAHALADLGALMYSGASLGSPCGAGSMASRHLALAEALLSHAYEFAPTLNGKGGFWVHDGGVVCCLTTPVQLSPAPASHSSPPIITPKPRRPPASPAAGPSAFAEGALRPRVLQPQSPPPKRRRTAPAAAASHGPVKGESEGEGRGEGGGEGGGVGGGEGAAAGPSAPAGGREQAEPAKKASWWSEAGDKELKRLVALHGEGQWSQIAKAITLADLGDGGRTGKQCRERWLHVIVPRDSSGAQGAKKTSWTADEERKFVDAHRRLGNKWTMIAKEVGRPENATKNHWNATKRRRSSNPRDKSSPKILREYMEEENLLDVRDKKAA